MKKLLLSILFLLCLIINSYAKEKIKPSFDCKKASTKVEKMICSDAELAQSDKELNELYNKYIEFVSENLPDYKDIVIKAQRNWMRERNKITDIQNLKVYYNRIVYEFGDAFNPRFSPAGSSDYDDEDVAYYWKYKPISFYFKNGYVKDIKNPVYVLYNDDEICQNISSVKLLDFNDFKKRAAVLTNFYIEQENGTLETTSSMSYRAENTYVTKYDNGYFAINNSDFSVSFEYMKKNDKGYYIPYIKRTYYDYDYKKLPKTMIWMDIIRMQQDEPLYDGVSSAKKTINILNIPVIYKNKVYLQELTVYDDIEYSGIDYSKTPPVYDKSVVIKVESPLNAIYSYNNDGSTKLVCVYTEEKNNINKKYDSYLRRYSTFIGNSYLTDYVEKADKFLDYF